MAAREKGEGLVGLFLSCSDTKERRAELVPYALQIIRGADLDTVDTATGATLLMLASRFEEFDGVAAYVIAAGAKLDVVDNFGWSALIQACCNKRASTALLLLEAGAAPNLANKVGDTALDFSNKFALPLITAALRARGGRTGAELKAAREQGARDKAARAKLSKKAAREKGEQLLAACVRWDAAAALRLIGEGADPDCTHKSSDVETAGVTPLMVASCDAGQDTVAARLVAAGADLNVVKKLGGTALMAACAQKRVATAMLLVEAGAKLNVVSEDGNTALDVAELQGLSSVSAAIRARGGRTGEELAESSRAQA